METAKKVEKMAKKEYRFLVRPKDLGIALCSRPLLFFDLLLLIKFSKIAFLELREFT